MGARWACRRPSPLLPISAVRARPQALLILVLLIALVVPSAAFAQSAGDDQYSDPFGEDQQQEQQPASQQPETPAAAGRARAGRPTAPLRRPSCLPSRATRACR